MMERRVRHFIVSRVQAYFENRKLYLEEKSCGRNGL
jgi:hypothetical protein